jgi:S-adenosylmethionine/arginine decarboxylase-like enzyme
VETPNYFHTNINGRMYYGQHLIMDCKSCNFDLLSEEKIKDFFRELVPAIDMVAFGEPQAHRFGEGDDVGISGVQFIVTSLIAIHTNDLYRDAYLDLFSCKFYEEEKVVDLFSKYFEPVSINKITLLRK